MNLESQKHPENSRLDQVPSPVGKSMSTTTDHFTEPDQESIALCDRAQEQQLRTMSWALDRIFAPAPPPMREGQNPSVPPHHYDVNLLDTPWSLDGRSEVSEKTRVVDRNGKLVALFVHEDVAMLVVHLMNKVPADQITDDI